MQFKMHVLRPKVSRPCFHVFAWESTITPAILLMNFGFLFFSVPSKNLSVFPFLKCPPFPIYHRVEAPFVESHKCQGMDRDERVFTEAQARIQEEIPVPSTGAVYLNLRSGGGTTLKVIPHSSKLGICEANNTR